MPRYWPVLVFLGGGLGSVLRAYLSAQVPAPWGTVAINVIGSAILAGVANPASGAGSDVRTFVGIGVLGGFTTYSTFSVQVLDALQARDYGLALGQLVATVGGGLIGAVVGWAAMDAWASR